MSQRKSQLTVGLFVLFATTIAVVLTFQFGKLNYFFQEQFTIAIHFDYAPGLEAGTPIQQNGITIGSIREVRMDQQRGGIIVLADVRADRNLKKDTQPQMVRSLLGDSSIELVPGSSEEQLKHGDLLKGLPPDDPLETMHRLEKQVATTMSGFETTSKEFANTSQEWQKVAKHLNNLMETRQGSLDVVIERAASSLHQLTQTLNTANTTLEKANLVIADPKLQENLKRTIEQFPLIVEEARTTIRSAKNTVESIKQSVDEVKNSTRPVTEGSVALMNKAKSSLARLDRILDNAELISKMLASEEGSLQRFSKDPQLYQNMNNSAASLSVMLKNLAPILSDLEIFQRQNRPASRSLRSARCDSRKLWNEERNACKSSFFSRAKS